MNMRFISLVPVLSLATVCLAFAPGCMSSRGVCSVSAPCEVKQAVTQNKYRISQIRQRLPRNVIVNVHSDSRMRELLGSAFELDDMTSFTPGAWASDGVPVTITFSDWKCISSGAWSVFPCLITLGIFPYMHHEEISTRVTVSRDDGRGSSAFSYTETDDWRISYLLPCGYIPYSEKVLGKNEFQLCGRGDVTERPHFAGLAHGLVAALADIEKNQQKQ